nr:reverse transcriptase domain-containing protein [Tanacetum cinerariifolium]
MSGDDPLQTTVQEATVDPGKPSAGPTPITQDAGGPSDTILEPNLKDPIMQFVVHNFDRMNAMYKAFTRKLKDIPRRQIDKHISRLAARHTKSYKAPDDTFTALIKSPAEILATSEGKAMLRPPPRMFAPANNRDRTKYYEFHEDHGHDTNDYDPIPENYSGDDSLIIKADVGITYIQRIYMDGGRSAEIMYEHCFEQLTPEEKEAMRLPTVPLVGFAGQISRPLGLITLTITIYDYRGHISQTIVVDFMIIRAPLPYNIILGRPGLMKLGAVASTLHSLIKFQTKEGITIVRGERLQTNVCNQISQKKTNDIKGMEHIVLNDEHSDQMLAIASNLPKTLKEKLRELLRSNKDIFTLTPVDIIGIPWELAEHRLNIHP